ncbi:MAG UNVERIFIED_CONTAM: DUF3604 domain-containing protein [Anaerolineae bacterium]
MIEIPTPRWTAYDQLRFGIRMPKEVPDEAPGARLDLADLALAAREASRSLAPALRGAGAGRAAAAGAALACGRGPRLHLLAARRAGAGLPGSRCTWARRCGRRSWQVRFRATPSRSARTSCRRPLGAAAASAPNAYLRQFATQLAPHGAATAPSLSVVPAGPGDAEPLRGRQTARCPGAAPCRGSAAGDVVVVTELPVVEAIALGSWAFAEALDTGVLRLYVRRQALRGHGVVGCCAAEQGPAVAHEAASGSAGSRASRCCTSCAGRGALRGRCLAAARPGLRRRRTDRGDAGARAQPGWQLHPHLAAAAHPRGARRLDRGPRARGGDGA